MKELQILRTLVISRYFYHENKKKNTAENLQ